MIVNLIPENNANSLSYLTSTDAEYVRKEKQVCHLWEVAMATPQQTLDRTKVFPINAFFPLKWVWPHCVASGLGGSATEYKKKTWFKQHSCIRVWWQVMQKPHSDILRLAEGQNTYVHPHPFARWSWKCVCVYSSVPNTRLWCDATTEAGALTWSFNGSQTIMWAWGLTTK